MADVWRRHRQSANVVRQLAAVLLRWLVAVLVWHRYEGVPFVVSCDGGDAGSAGEASDG